MMDTTTKMPLIIPVENQVRELDPKLLLACVAALRGFASYIGSHREIDFRIASFPRSIYLCKSMTARNLNMFYIIHKCGHEIVTWDEEALVHLPPDTYFSRRLSPKAIRYVSHLFAWGEDNAELWRQYDALPDGMPIHVTGNPRSDMLRPDLHPFYEEEVAKLRDKFGNFILVNTNFNHVNAYFPAQNLFRPVKNPAEVPKFGKAAVGMSRDYAEGLRDHKQSIFEAFQQLIYELDKAFPQYTIIVRPHPTESQQIYQEIARRCTNVQVTNEGNVVPWLLATKAVIHNGCTTGVEAYIMQVPAISYRAKINEHYDLGFYRLPNLISHQCFDLEQLCETLQKILRGDLGAANGAERESLVDGYLTGRDGSLASERIVNALEGISEQAGRGHRPLVGSYMLGWGLANGRRAVKYIRKHLPGKHAPPEFHRHRYPGITLPELERRIHRFQQVLGDSRIIRADQMTDQIFHIHPGH